MRAEGKARREEGAQEWATADAALPGTGSLASIPSTLFREGDKEGQRHAGH